LDLISTGALCAGAPAPWDGYRGQAHDGTLKIIGANDPAPVKLAEYPGEDEGAERCSSVIPVGPSRIVLRGGARLKCLGWEPAAQ
jgi:hypothetical protein